MVDISNSQYEYQITAVNKILADLELDDIPMIYALNKQDRVDTETAARIAGAIGGITISANDETTLMPLIEEIQVRIERIIRNNTVHNP